MTEDTHVNIPQFLGDLLKQVGLEALIVFCILLLDVAVFFQKDAVLGGFITSNESNLSPILSTALHLTLTYVIIGYGLGLFFFRTLIKPYVWKAFALAGEKFSFKELAVLQGFVLSALIICVDKVRIAFSFVTDDLGTQHIQTYFTRHSYPEALIISAVLLLIAFAVLAKLKSHMASWRWLLAGFIFIAGLATVSFVPNFDTLYARAEYLRSQRVLVYYTNQITAESDWRRGKTVNYNGPSKAELDAMEQEDEALYKRAMQLARNDREYTAALEGIVAEYTTNSYMASSDQQKVFEIISMIDPDDAFVQNQLALQANREGNYQGAVEHAKMCVKNADMLVNPTRCYESLFLGYIFQGDGVSAQSALADMQARYPEWPDTQWWTNVLSVWTEVYHITYQEFADLFAKFEKICNYKFNSEYCYELMARMRWGSFNYDTAEGIFDKWQKAYPYSAIAPALRAQMERDRSALEEVFTKNVEGAHNWGEYDTLFNDAVEFYKPMPAI